MFTKRLMLAAVIAAAFGAASCSKDAPDHPLAYAPADTAYLLANLEPVPTAATDMWMKNAEQMMPIYEKMLDSMATQMEGDAAADQLAVKLVKAMRDEFKGKFNKAGIESMGFTMQSRSAFYGIGLIPVMRLELGDADAFKALVGRMEAKVGEKLGTGKVGDQEYWIAGPAEAKFNVIVAVQGKHLVITMAAKATDEAVLKQLLGVELPKESALDADVLPGFNKERGYLPYGSGYIDTAKMLAAVYGERTPAEKAFLDAIGETNPAANVSEVCKTEQKAIAAQVPRLSFGYTELDAKHMNIRYALETAPAVGAELSKLAVPVPGLDARGQGLFDVGFGLDLNALVSFVNAKSGAVAAAPYQCESLLPLNDAFAKARENVSNPGVFMAAAAFKGFNASLSKLEMPEAQMPVIEGKIAIASDNPQSLLSMAGSMAPQFAALNLQPNQAPVALPADAMPPGTPPTYVALTDKALGLAIGESQQGSLQAFLTAANKGPSPILHYGLDGAGMSTFFDMVIKQSEAQLAVAESMAAVAEETPDESSAEDEAGEGEEVAEISSDDSAKKTAELRTSLESMKAMRDIYTKFIARADFTIYANQRGIEAGYAIEMK
jgi:hypothetical protein